ncbi:MAG: thermonuclease family protein [Parvularculaceae bacterium]|nr:thermonuclease family protein [Parvularculaceae bacterium]
MKGGALILNRNGGAGVFAMLSISIGISAILSPAAAQRLVRMPGAGGDAPETPASAPQHLSSDGFSATVAHVIDGDTFVMNGVGPRIRVWGLDAPERGAPGGAEATAAMTRIALGRRLKCRRRDIDRYGRIVAQCFTETGEDITAMMIQRGVAREYVRFTGGYYRAQGVD